MSMSACMYVGEIEKEREGIENVGSIQHQFLSRGLPVQKKELTPKKKLVKLIVDAPLTTLTQSTTLPTLTTLTPFDANCDT